MPMPIGPRGAASAFLLALAACSEERAVEREVEALVQRPADAPAAERIPCAHAGDELAVACTVDREATAQGATLTVRHPDGAFRRLIVTGEGIAAADGAEVARVTVLDQGTVEVALGGDRYRLPATVQGEAARP